MKKFFLTSLLLGLFLLITIIQAAPPPGYQIIYSAIGHVYDQDGNPESGVKVKFKVMAFDEEGTDSYFTLVDGYTNSSGYFYLSISVSYWDYPVLGYMIAFIDDSRYTTLEENGNYSRTGTTIYPNLKGCIDLDRDAVPDEWETLIAEKFKPVLHKHSFDLQQGLANFGQYVAGGRFRLIAYNNLGEQLYSQIVSGSSTALHKWNYWNWDTYGYGSLSQGVYNLDLDNNYRYQGSPSGQRPLYYHVYKDNGYYYIQYWYYLSMDDKRDQLQGIAATYHESDWEHITIQLIRNQDGAFVPNKINFYMHDGGRTAIPSECWWSNSNLQTYDGIVCGYQPYSTHLHIWISANGHASYNRFWQVYKRSALGYSYQDRVDYEPSGNNLYFVYDYLINFGEILKAGNAKCPDNGYSYSYHCYPIGQNSVHWLAYVGRTGEWLDPIFIQSGRPPLLPAHEQPDSKSHEWMSFSIGGPRFGNDGAEWVNDTSEGD